MFKPGEKIHCIRSPTLFGYKNKKIYTVEEYLPKKWAAQGGALITKEFGYRYPFLANRFRKISNKEFVNMMIKDKINNEKIT